MIEQQQALAGIARRQHGLATRVQLLECGCTERRIGGLVARGILRRVRRGVYAIAGAPTTWQQALMAAVLDAGETAVASHSSAARLSDFRYAPDDGFEVTVLRGRAQFARGVWVHRSVALDPKDVVKRDGIPCTTFERTLCDLTTRLSWLQLGRVLDDGLRRKETTLDRLTRCVARTDSGPGRRLSVVQGLLAQRGTGYNPGGSDTELRLLEVFERAGLPAPVQQFEVRPAKRRYFLDYSWPEWKVFVEWYGLPWHVGATAVARDNARLTELSAVGWRPLIFTDESTETEIATQTAALLTEVGSIAHRRGA